MADDLIGHHDDDTAGVADGASASQPWWVYLLRCADGTLYTGCTIDLERRVTQHNLGRGARYTRGRGPVTLVAAQHCTNRGAALRLERWVKRLSPARKLAFMRDALQRRGVGQAAVGAVCPLRTRSTGRSGSPSRCDGLVRTI